MRCTFHLSTCIAGGLMLAAALTLTGCSASIGEAEPAAPSSNKAETNAAILRSSLDCLLREHVVLTLAATDAALGGRNDEYTAAANALDANSHQLAAALGSVWGKDTQDSFYTLWSKHLSFIIDYTQGVLANDDAKKTTAINNLITWTQDMGAFMETASGGHLKKNDVTDLMKTHISGIKSVIDAQAQKDYATAFEEERDAEHHMENVGNAIADAMVDQYPDRY